MHQPEPSPEEEHAAIMAELADIKATIQAEHAAIRTLGAQVLEALRKRLGLPPEG